MKEIVYGPQRIAEIVADSTYNGVRYVVVNRGTHPCAYVQCDADWLKEHQDEEYDNIDVICVHGGVTFGGEIKKLKGCQDIPGTWFGWDYAHCDDWAGYHTDEQNLLWGNRKYTTAMIVDECKRAIDQYLESKKLISW